MDGVGDGQGGSRSHMDEFDNISSFMVFQTFTKEDGNNDGDNNNKISWLIFSFHSFFFFFLKKLCFVIKGILGFWISLQQKKKASIRKYP